MDDELIEDLGGLQALTHPLRLRLLSALRLDGPATASDLGRRLGRSSGATSYHLRQLARFGFVTDDPDPSDQRTRRWRATSQRTRLRRDLLREEPAAADAVGALVRVQVAEVVDALSALTHGAGDDAWVRAATSTDHHGRYTAAQLETLVAELLAVIARHDGARPVDEDQDTRLVTLYLGAAPVAEE